MCTETFKPGVIPHRNKKFEHKSMNHSALFKTQDYELQIQIHIVLDVFNGCEAILCTTSVSEIVGFITSMYALSMT